MGAARRGASWSRTQHSIGLWAYPENGTRPVELAVRDLRPLRRGAHGRPRPARDVHSVLLEAASRCRAKDGGFPYTATRWCREHDRGRASRRSSSAGSSTRRRSCRVPELDAACEQRASTGSAKRFRADRNPSGPTRRIPAQPAVLLLLPLRGRARGRPRRESAARRARLVPRGRHDRSSGKQHAAGIGTTS